jgi:hypothetical protein
MATVLPLATLKTRPPEHGRIRFGEKYIARNGRSAMRATDTWRFTSPDRTAIEQLAGIYGGTVRPWSDPKAGDGQWEVQTDSDRIDVWIPPDACSSSYELWGGGGCERRCDGSICTRYGAHGSVEEPCLCAGQAEQTCKPTIRIQLILPAIRFGGVWRLDSHSENLLREAPGMISMIEFLQQQGLPQAELVLTKRQKTQGGKTKKFTVPQFVVPASPAQIANGDMRVTALETPKTLHPSSGLALPSRSEVEVDEVFHTSLYVVEAPADVVDAEVIEPSPVASEPEGWDVPPKHVRVVRNRDPHGPKWVRA